ncbi:hypothetical protein Tco_1324874, partial [Tanacetum coccineum]
FLSQKGSWGGIGVNEKNGVALSAKEKNGVAKDGVAPSVTVPSGNNIGTQTLLQIRIKIDVVVLIESLIVISERFVNTVNGYFLEKRVAYPVVANYVRNTLGKYGLDKLMLNSSTRLSLFHLSSMDGFDSMLGYRPWFIRNNSLTLKNVGSECELIER